MSLSSGTVVGQYRVGRKLGSGGMGEVYQATHMVLRRDVALKTLRPEPGEDLSHGGSLIEEARAASALDHPHIVTVYDVAEVDGTVYIAMEYVEGQTLRQALSQRALRLKETLQYSIQIANALAAAHDAGILHLDVKPGNIMITRKNVVKVVDFGIARLSDPLESSIKEDAPTRTMNVGSNPSHSGQISGTVGYMSPEQIRGLKVDARTDIFSFGIVLYEMLSRVRPFAAPSEIGVTASILDTEPRPVRELTPDVPEELDDLVRFCLRKEPDERARSMHDVGHTLQVILQSLEQRSASAVVLGRRRRWLIAGVVMLALIAGSALEAFLAARSRQVPQLIKLRRITWDGGLAMLPALSDDGRLLAFASDRVDGKHLEIFVRHMSGGEPVRLTNNVAGDTEPSFSPDGGLIAFHSNRPHGGAYIIPSFGGQERLIATEGNNPRFSPDGKWIAYWVGDDANLSPSARSYVVASSGGIPRQLQPSFADARYPIWTPDGKHILFQGMEASASSPDWWVTPVDGGKASKTGAWEIIHRAGFPLIYLPGGWSKNSVVFSARNDAVRFVLSLPLSMNNWQVQKPPEALTFGTGVDGDPYPSPSGETVFTSYRYEINIWSRRVDESGRLKDEEARKLTSGDAYHLSASLDESGTRMVFLSGRSPRLNVWVKDLATGKEAAVTVDESSKCSAAISPDGSRVAWSLCGTDQEPIYLAEISSDLSISVPEQICNDCGRILDWSPKGDELLYLDHVHPRQVGILGLNKTSRKLVASSSYNLDRARFSPEANWIVLRASKPRKDRARIFAIRLQEGTPAGESNWIAITNGDSWDDNPVWTKKGDAVLFYSRRDGFVCLWRQALNLETRRPEGLAQEIIPFHDGRLSIKELFGSLPSLSLEDHQILFNALERTGSIWVLDSGGSAGRPKY